MIFLRTKCSLIVYGNLRGPEDYQAEMRKWSLTLKNYFIQQIEQGIEKFGYILKDSVPYQLEYLRLKYQEEKLLIPLKERFSKRKTLIFTIFGT